MLHQKIVTNINNNIEFYIISAMILRLDSDTEGT